MAPLSVLPPMEPPYMLEGIAGARPVLYTVRNTFVDVLHPQDDESPSEGIFSTWPLRAAPEVPAANVAVAEAASSPHQAQDTPVREEGEIPEEEDELEEGELPDESEEDAEGDRHQHREPEDGDAEDSDGSPDTDSAPQPDRPPSSRAGMSVGSKLHYDGSCRPCAWLYKSAEGCWHGDKCEYCHLCPPGEVKRRKREKARSVAEAEQRLRQRALAVGQLPTLHGVLPGVVGRPAGAAVVAQPGDVPAMEPCYVEVVVESPSRFVDGQPRGALGHSMGQCRPCAWVHKDASGCKNGNRCKFCHLCPPGELKRRKRQKRCAQALAQGASELQFQVFPDGVGFADSCY